MPTDSAERCQCQRGKVGRIPAVSVCRVSCENLRIRALRNLYDIISGVSFSTQYILLYILEVNTMIADWTLALITVVRGYKKLPSCHKDQ